MELPNAVPRRPRPGLIRPHAVAGFRPTCGRRQARMALFARAQPHGQPSTQACRRACIARIQSVGPLDPDLAKLVVPELWVSPHPRQSGLLEEFAEWTAGLRVA